MSIVDNGDDLQQMIAAGKESLATGRLPAGLLANPKLHDLENQRVFGRCWQFFGPRVSRSAAGWRLCGPLPGGQFGNRCARRGRHGAGDGEFVPPSRHDAVSHRDGQHLAF